MTIFPEWCAKHHYNNLHCKEKIPFEDMLAFQKMIFPSEKSKKKQQSCWTHLYTRLFSSLKKVLFFVSFFFFFFLSDFFFFLIFILGSREG